ncbi:transporter substrate-binding domain-containing protein [uncultured Parolsenella sp.]|uniref:transporter substrate-binding domain-containing protein n=1 Tax=uncultured Parolsenella sp. TaxID=2083008 RepID=UPI0028054AAD|nr:transporter substrate-binding domain-containing protein [uncultured Parolsenella sp.]
MSNKTYSRRQFLSLGLGLAGATTLFGLAGCSEGPSDAAATSSAAATGASAGVDIDKDAFNELVASIEPAADDVIEANSWAKAIKDAGTFRLGATRTSAIFSQLDEQDGKVYGFDAGLYLGLIRYILGDETKYDYTQLTSDTRESVLQNDTVDAVFASYTITDKRKEVVSFAGPYMSTQYAVLVLADNADINSVDDLAGKKVAVQSGSTGPEVVGQYAPKAEIQEFSKDDECRAALEQGRVDAYVVDNTLQMGNVVKNPGKYRIAGDAFGPEEYLGIGVKLGNTDAVDFINAFLKKFEDDGNWEKLYKISLADRCGVDTIPEPPAIGA